ncbi:hypothetical protein C4D60_Mb04t27360 [Musa balbisiana]|uniref:Uncharacterized protein n=1 Tax=Musa balbisiana TaxID=52838 RepID=A0A4S8KF05_MUSBA|nr:hypothetical protein C4D60_Mb04t27360 [Musa balbisiana]
MRAHSIFKQEGTWKRIYGIRSSSATPFVQGFNESVIMHVGGCRWARRCCVDSLASFGKSRFGAREGKLDELDRDAGSPDAADDGLGPGNVDGGGDEADAGASLGEEDGHVGHGDHVPLRQEGN